MNIRSVFDNPWVYGASQKLIPFTVWVYEDLIRRRVQVGAGQRLLDIGCGMGAHRKFFPQADYTGIDINPGYIERANRAFGGGFAVGDATKLDFGDGAFDRTLCVATFHHLSDEQARSAIAESWRVVRSGGAVHIIDPVLPANPRAWVKQWVFANDRGRFQRTENRMLELAREVAPVAAVERVCGTLHDVIYFRLEKS